jgi:hypothetical protein
MCVDLEINYVKNGRIYYAEGKQSKIEIILSSQDYA